MTHTNFLGYYVKVKLLSYRDDKISFYTRKIYCGIGNLGLAEAELAIKKWVKNRFVDSYCDTILSLRATTDSCFGDPESTHPFAEFYEVKYREIDSTRNERVLLRTGTSRPIEDYLEEYCGKKCVVIKCKKSDVSDFVDYSTYYGH